MPMSGEVLAAYVAYRFIVYTVLRPSIPAYSWVYNKKIRYNFALKFGLICYLKIFEVQRSFRTGDDTTFAKGNQVAYFVPLISQCAQT